MDRGKSECDKRNGSGLSGLNDWISPAYVTRKMSVISPEDGVMLFWIKMMSSKKKK